MIECRVLCEQQTDVEGISGQEDWLPTAFNEDAIESVKIAGPDPDVELGGITESRCSTIFFRSGNVMIVDIPYSKLKEKLWPTQQ